MSSDPSALAVHNGQFLGLEGQFDDSRIVMQQLPWDVTTSYRPGTVKGPETIVDASYQLDLFSPRFPEVWKIPVHTLELNSKYFNTSVEMRKQSEKIIEFLEEGGDPVSSAEIQKLYSVVNAACRQFHDQTYFESLELLKKGKRVLTIGGDHSITWGPLKAAAEHFSQLSVLHFDAHADLRNAYEGFPDSHASIMFNALQFGGLTKLVQVGVRDVSQVEVDLIQKDARISTYFDWDLQERKFRGESWAQTCPEIVSKLTDHVYISFDIDGLDPKLCPHTGTPVPGGLEFAEATHLIHEVVRSGRKIVGADLVEVAPGPEGDEWDGNVGARVAFQLLLAMAKSL